eukprot:7232_1
MTSENTETPRKDSTTGFIKHPEKIASVDKKVDESMTVLTELPQLNDRSVTIKTILTSKNTTSDEIMHNAHTKEEESITEIMKSPSHQPQDTIELTKMFIDLDPDQKLSKNDKESIKNELTPSQEINNQTIEILHKNLQIDEQLPIMTQESSIIKLQEIKET